MNLTRTVLKQEAEKATTITYETRERTRRFRLEVKFWDRCTSQMSIKASYSIECTKRVGELLGSGHEAGWCVTASDRANNRSLKRNGGRDGWERSALVKLGQEIHRIETSDAARERESFAGARE